MAHWSLRTLFGQVLSSPARGKRPARPLAVEPLEDRCLLSTLQALSLPPGAGAPAGDSFATAVSADGRYTVFTSSAPGLVANEVNTNGSPNVFLYDDETGSVNLVNHRPGLPGMTGNGGLGAVPAGQLPGYLSPVISGDGRFIAFPSYDTDLVPNEVLPPGTSGPVLCLYLYDTATGSIRLVNHAPGAAAVIDAVHQAASPAINADGSQIAYVSGTTPQGSGDLALYDAAADATSYTADVTSTRPLLSADGKSVAYADSTGYHLAVRGRTGPGIETLGGASTATANDLGLGSGSVAATSTTPPVTVPFNGTIRDAVFSADGKYLVFVGTPAQTTQYTPPPDIGTLGNTLLTQTDPPALLPIHGPPVHVVSNVYLYDVSGGSVRLVSGVGGSAAGGGNGNSDSPVISADDSSIAYRSDATNLVPGQTAAGSNIYEFDVQAQTQTLVSHVAGDPTTAAGDASAPAIDSDGHLVGYVSTAPDAVPDQTGPAGVRNVFLWLRPTGDTLLVSGAGGSANVTGDGDSYNLLLAGDHVPVFTSVASNLGHGGGGHPVVYASIQVDVTLSPDTVRDGSPAGAWVGTLSVSSSYAGQYVTPKWRLPPGQADNASFALGSSAGASVPLVMEVPAGYAARPLYVLRVHVNAGFGNQSANLDVFVTAPDGGGGGGGTETVPTGNDGGGGTGNPGDPGGSLGGTFDGGGGSGPGNTGGHRTGRAVGGTTVVLVPMRVGKRKATRLMAQVVSPLTGAVEQFLSPYQRPAYQNIQVSMVDSNGDDVPDEVVFTARKGRKWVSTVFSV